MRPCLSHTSVRLPSFFTIAPHSLSSIRVPFTARVGHRQVYKHVFDLIGGSSSLDYHFELGPGDLERNGTHSRPHEGVCQYLLGPLNASSRPRHRLPLAFRIASDAETGGQSRENRPVPAQSHASHDTAKYRDKNGHRVPVHRWRVPKPR
ncbi:hypothetical protein BJV77DRAFT_97335 [Russula vinacea]|nr:hypothetical protein BJV77DRAFT_97335 [Russula vinacea]